MRLLNLGRCQRAIAACGQVLAVAAVVLPALDARAASCGGNQPCACGDKVVRDYTLPADLGPCSEDGLRVVGGVTLDGGGHTIRGSGGKGVGLRLGDDAGGAHVHDLRVTAFEHGVRLIGTRGARLTGIEAHGNGDPGEREGYGVDLSSGASDNVLERLRVHDNADEGIHVGTQAARNRIVDSDVAGSGRENVYFLACQDNRLERSRLRASGSANASVFVKFASGTTLAGNTVDGGVVAVRGGSSGTTLTDNTLTGASVVLQGQDDERFGRGTPSATTIRGGSIASREACVRVDDATGTRIEDVRLSCPEGIRVASGSRVAVHPSTGADGKPTVRCEGAADCTTPFVAATAAAGP